MSDELDPSAPAQPAFASSLPPSDDASAVGDLSTLDTMTEAAANAALDLMYTDPKHAFRTPTHPDFRAWNAWAKELSGVITRHKQTQQGQRVGPWDAEPQQPEPESLRPLPSAIPLPELPLGQSWDQTALAELHSGALNAGVREGDLVAIIEAFAAEVRSPMPRANADSLINALERQHGSAEAAADVLEMRGNALAAFPKFRATFMNSPARYSPRVATLLAQVWQSRTKPR